MTRRPFMNFMLLAGCSMLPFAPATAQNKAEPDTALESGDQSVELAGVEQDMAASEDGASSEDAQDTTIYVTANRRQEALEDVPLSISVLTNQDLTRAGVSVGTEIQVTTTNVQIGTLNGQPLAYIRGMGSANLNAGSEGAVGLYIDGIYVPWSPAIDSSFLDVERVEVLKGPQGTLYGRNTTAGAINFISRDPSAREAIEAQLTLGTWGTQRAQVYYATGPGTLSASIAAGVNRHNGFLRNLGSGPDFDDRDEWGVRAKVRAELSDRWTATIAGDFTRRRDLSSDGFISYRSDLSAADPAIGGNFTTIDDDPSHTFTDFETRGTKYRNYGGSLTVRGEFDFADFVSLSGYRDVSLFTSPDADASDVNLTNFDARNLLESWSQEFQLVSNGSSDIDWIVGLYTFQSDGGLAPVGIFGPPNPGGPVGGFGNPNQYQNAQLVLEGLGQAEAYAAYAQITVPITDQLGITGGLRYSWEERRLTRQRVTVPALGNLVVIDVPEKSESWDSLDPKIGLQWDSGDHLIYANASRGFRSGNFAIASPGAEGPVDPEKVTSFEVGGHHQFGRAILFNWAGFYNEYSDLQIAREINTGTGSLFSLQNAADATIWGFEADVTIRAIDNLVVNAGASYTNAKFDEFKDASAFLPASETPALNDGPLGSDFGYVQASVDVSGRPLARAPKWTFFGQATYTIPIGDGSLDLSGNVYHASKHYLDTPSNIFEDGYVLVNLRAEYTLPGDSISVAAFVNNVGNVRYVESASTNAHTFIVQPSDPRIIGASISLKY